MYQTETQDKLLRKSDVVNRLSLSLRSVDRLVASGKLKKVYVMGAVRFRESGVQALIEKGCKLYSRSSIANGVKTAKSRKIGVIHCATGLTICHVT